MMVVAGFLVFGERLNRFKTLAIALAAAGVALQIWLAGSMSWSTAWVCLTYPIYYTSPLARGTVIDWLVC